MPADIIFKKLNTQEEIFANCKTYLKKQGDYLIRESRLSGMITVDVLLPQKNQFHIKSYLYAYVFTLKEWVYIEQIESAEQYFNNKESYEKLTVVDISNSKKFKQLMQMLKANKLLENLVLPSEELCSQNQISKHYSSADSEKNSKQQNLAIKIEKDPLIAKVKIEQLHNSQPSSMPELENHFNNEYVDETTNQSPTKKFKHG